jgi:hypothetical protein
MPLLRQSYENNPSTEPMQIVVFIECNQTTRCTMYSADSDAGHRWISTTNHLFVTFVDDDLLTFFL